MYKSDLYTFLQDSRIQEASNCGTIINIDSGSKHYSGNVHTKPWLGLDIINIKDSSAHNYNNKLSDRGREIGGQET